MSEPLLGVVVAHGGLAAALVDAVRRITGESEGLIPVSNTDCGRDDLSRQIAKAAGDRPALVFVDMPSGSCFQASAACLRERSNVAIVAGVNLAMLLDFFYHRDLTPEAAAERAIATGERAIRIWGR